jgi:hypothetical protein
VIRYVVVVVALFLRSLEVASDKNSGESRQKFGEITENEANEGPYHSDLLY